MRRKFLQYLSQPFLEDILIADDNLQDYRFCGCWQLTLPSKGMEYIKLTDNNVKNHPIKQENERVALKVTLQGAGSERFVRNYMSTLI